MSRTRALSGGACFGCFFLGRDVGGLPLLGGEQQRRIEVGRGSPEAHQPGDAPGHDHEQHQRLLEARNGGELQRLDPTALLQDQKEQLDFPARAVPVHRSGGDREVGKLSDSEQAPPAWRALAGARARLELLGRRQHEARQVVIEADRAR